MNGKLTIITGASGAGKSTKARRIKQLDPENVQIVEDAQHNWIYVASGLDFGKHVVAVFSGDVTATHFDVKHDDYFGYMAERDELEEEND